MWRWPRRAETLNVPAALFAKWMRDVAREQDERRQRERSARILNFGGSVQHCWLCRRDFADDVRMITPPRESSHICSECAYENPIGQRLMNRDKRLADGYYPGSHIKGERFRQALRHAKGLPKQTFRESMGEKK